MSFDENIQFMVKSLGSTFGREMDKMCFATAAGTEDTGLLNSQKNLIHIILFPLRAL
jgi:hypothetical protein